MDRHALVLMAAGLAWLAIGIRWFGSGDASGTIGVPAQVSGWMRIGRNPGLPVRELLSALAAELSAGQPTGAALERACADLAIDPCPTARAAAQLGGDVAAGLRADASAPGGADLAGLAACWEVAQRSGAGLAVAVSRLAESVRATEHARAQLAGEVAAARATARLLAVLPVLGLVLGHWLGADPVSFLTGSVPGRICLIGGLTLQVVGMLWLRVIIARAGAVA